MPVIGPTVLRRQLGARLRLMREGTKKKIADVPSDIMSSTKLMKIESGKIATRLPDIWALCRLYGADTQETNKLASLAEAARESGWWESYKDIVPEYLGLYVELEEAAKKLTTYHPELVLGLLQTEDYARAVLADGQNDPQEIEWRLAFRLERQARVLKRTNPPAPEMKVILGEGALHLVVGSQEVMAAQRAHLVEMAEVPGIDVLVLPYSAGAHPGMRGPFNLLEFDDEHAPFVAYAETLRGAKYMETPSDVREYQRTVGLLEDRCFPIKEYER